MTSLLTSTGLNKRQDTGRASFTHVAVGTNAQTPTEALTSMGSELVRKAATVSLSGAVITITVFVNSNEGNGTWTEWAIWDALSGGNMLAYGTFDTSIVKISTEGQLFTIQDTLSNAS